MGTNRLHAIAAHAVHVPAGEAHTIVTTARRLFLTSLEEMNIPRSPAEHDAWFTRIGERLAGCTTVTPYEKHFLSHQLEAYRAKRAV